MTKALGSFPEWDRKRVAIRRANPKNGEGLGHVAAKDFLRKQGVEVEQVVEVETEEDVETEQ